MVLAVLLGLAPAAAAPPIPFELERTIRGAPCSDCSFGARLDAVGSRVLATRWRRAPGAVDLLDPDTGRVLRTFASPEPERTVDTFGLSVAVIRERSVLIGAPWGTATGAQGPVYAGVAYLFDVGSGALRHTFTGRAPREWDRFGASVAALDGTALVWGSAESAVHAFDADTGALLRVYPVSPRRDGRAGDRTIAALGADIVVADDEAVHVLDGATGAVRLTIGPPDEATLGPGILVHAGDVYAQGGRGVYRFDGHDGTLVRQYPGFTTPLAASECTLLLLGPACGGPESSPAAHLLDADTGRTLGVACGSDDPYGRRYSAGAIVGRRILLGDPSEDTQTVFVFAPRLPRGVAAGVPGGPRCLARQPFPPAPCDGTDLRRALTRRVRRARALLDRLRIEHATSRRAGRLLAAALRVLGAGRPIDPACRAALTAYLEALARRLHGASVALPSANVG